MLTKPVVLAALCIALGACSDASTGVAPARPRPISSTKDWITLSGSGGLSVDVTYPHTVYGGMYTAWSGQPRGGVPPYTFHWDVTVCPASGGAGYAELSETIAGGTSLFEQEAAKCTDRDYYLNLLVTDAAGNGTSWTHRYQLNTTYYPTGSPPSCDEVLYCPPGEMQ